MKPIIHNASYMIPESEIPEVSDPTEIHFTRFGQNQYPMGNPNFTSRESYKIFCHVNEPTTSRWVEPIEHIIKHHKAYDKIVTSNSIILEKCKNAVFMIYGTTWLNKSKHHPDSFGKYSDDLENLNKELSISMVCGSLSGKTGYDLRHIIFSNKEKIKIKKNFFSSTRFPIYTYEKLPNDDKIHLFSSMYSVAIESTQEENYISEKLIDCLVTKTIPVYWGCPNVSDFFDTSYWINIENIFVNDYSEDWYYKNLDKINENFKKSQKYCENIFKRVLEIK